jgi:hypothetical protein
MLLLLSTTTTTSFSFCVRYWVKPSPKMLDFSDFFQCYWNLSLLEVAVADQRVRKWLEDIDESDAPLCCFLPRSI